MVAWTTLPSHPRRFMASPHRNRRLGAGDPERVTIGQFKAALGPHALQ
jgi:hypothetical protein